MPITRVTATNSPQAAIISGLRRTALTDVCIATIAPTSRSSSSGKETTLIVSTKTANRKPMPFPLMMAAWGLFVAVTLMIGSLPFFVGLAVVLPVLAHSTWHLYRKVVEPDLSPRLDRDRFPWTHGDAP